MTIRYTARRELRQRNAGEAFTAESLSAPLSRCNCFDATTQGRTEARDRMTLRTIGEVSATLLSKASRANEAMQPRDGLRNASC